MILFQNWHIRCDGPLGRQYDHLSHRLEVVGQLPEGWTWEMLVRVGELENVILLTTTEGGAEADLTGDLLSVGGLYELQLRGRQGEILRHTNIVYGLVAGTISGEGDWPETAPGGSAATTLALTPQMFGAAGDGETDDTAAIQALFDQAGGRKKVYFPNGEYRTTGTITVDTVPDLEMDGILLADHGGDCLVLGRQDAYTVNKTVKIKLKKNGTAREEGSVGLVVGAFARSTFHLAFVNYFETNVKLLSVEKGIFFNTFHLDDLNYAKYGLYLDGTDGWINDNLFIGGSIGKTGDGAAVTLIGCGSNVFLKNGMEGAGTAVNIVSGTRNTFLYSRCEASTYALVVGPAAGANNTMLSNYRNAVFVNDSPYSSSGVIELGIRETCRYPAVSVEHFDENRLFFIGNKAATEYCRFMSASGVIETEVSQAVVSIADGVMDLPSNRRPCFTFDTTKNKRFELPEGPDIVVVLYDADGRIPVTEDTVSTYIKVDYTAAPVIGANYGGGARLRAAKGFEVSGQVVKVDIVYMSSVYSQTTVNCFDIRTEYPCRPMMDDILTVSALPDNGYLGARVSYGGGLYTYDGTKWTASGEGGGAGGCIYPAVNIPGFDAAKLLTVGNKTITEYFKFISSSGTVTTMPYSTTVAVENGKLLLPLNSRPVFEFDTTRNKSFRLADAVRVIVCIYDSQGQVEVTADNVSRYITVDGGITPGINANYGQGAEFTAAGFEVSGEVTKIMLVYLVATTDPVVDSIGIFTGYPCQPVMDEIMAVSALPSNGYLGARVSLSGALYTYNGSGWKEI